MADSRPVGRLKPVPVRFAVCAAFGMGVMAIFAALAPRPDLAQQIVVPGFVFEIIGFGLASGLLAVLALRGAVPDREPGSGAVALALALTAFAAASALAHPRDSDILIGAFAGIGIPCAEMTSGLALAPGLALFVALRRGVPLAPATSGALAGGAALFLAYLAMRLHCAVDDGWHLFVWHGLPMIPAMIFGAVLGVVWLSRWRS